MDGVKIGSVLEDNDKREGGRRVNVSAIYTEPKTGVMYVIWNGPKRKAKIRMDRIHADGRKHTDGWSLVG